MTPRYAVVFSAAAVVLALVGAGTRPAFAQFDTPGIAAFGPWTAKTEVTITAGSTGAPQGFTIWWMKASDYAANGNEWFLYGDPRQGEAHFTGAPTLNTNDGQFTTFLLGPHESITVEIGDLNDESGVTTIYPAEDTDTGGELQNSTGYVFCGYANGEYPSELTITVSDATGTPDCTHTQGFWKNHEEDWDASCTPMVLGGNAYTQAELLAIFNTPVAGNGAISLAHQLIATKLNICTLGSATPACVATADALLATCGANKVPPSGTCNLAPGTTSSNTQCLDNFNNTSGNNCATANVPSSWGRVKTLYR